MDVMLRLTLAAVLGYLVGLERALAGQPAGERTHALAAVGAATFGLISTTGFPGSDPTRVAAGVVTGLGFLGAGMILRPAVGEVRGLTTAAGIWAVGASGLAIGMGLYGLGIGATLVVGILLLTERLTRIDERVARRRREGQTASELVKQAPTRPRSQGNVDSTGHEEGL